MNHGQDPHLSAHQISRSAYEESAPRLTGQRRKIVEALRQHGPQTANELARLLPHGEVSNFNVRSRLQELTKLGLVVIDRLVSDPVTGHRARCYRLAEAGEATP
jgi:predicted ArsR family transcriptional regulator